MIFNSLHRFTSAIPGSVSPEPVSGVDGKLNGTPSPKIVGRLQTGPIERKPAECKTSSI